jgi:hypothetical protein
MVRSLLLVLALAGLTPISSASPLCAAGAEGYICCKRCKAGKPCGDSCIAKTSNCTKPKGCACQG